MGRFQMPASLLLSAITTVTSLTGRRWLPNNHTLPPPRRRDPSCNESFDSLFSLSAGTARFSTATRIGVSSRRWFRIRSRSKSRIRNTLDNTHRRHHQTEFCHLAILACQTILGPENRGRGTRHRENLHRENLHPRALHRGPQQYQRRAEGRGRSQRLLLSSANCGSWDRSSVHIPCPMSSSDSWYVWMRPTGLPCKNQAAELLE
jgi:hypothetical protein